MILKVISNRSNYYHSLFAWSYELWEWKSDFTFRRASELELHHQIQFTLLTRVLYTRVSVSAWTCLCECLCVCVCVFWCLREVSMDISMWIEVEAHDPLYFSEFWMIHQMQVKIAPWQMPPYFAPKCRLFFH